MSPILNSSKFPATSASNPFEVLDSEEEENLAKEGSQLEGAGARSRSSSTRNSSSIVNSNWSGLRSGDFRRGSSRGGH